MALTLRLVRNANIPWRIVEDEAVLLDLEEGELLRLNQVGAEIWGALDGMRTVDDLVEHVEAVFHVSPRRARRDIRRFVNQLRRRDFVRELDEERTLPR